MAKTTKQIFYGSSFGDGAWAPDLKTAIDSKQRFLVGWRPRSRIWRGTWVQWVHFEPDDWSGPFFWSGKPALIASQPKASRLGPPIGEEALFVGYYIERGHERRPDMPAAQMDGGWHWHG